MTDHKLDRRAFLLGLGAAAAVPVIGKAPAGGEWIDCIGGGESIVGVDLAFGPDYTARWIVKEIRGGLVRITQINEEHSPGEFLVPNFIGPSVALGDTITMDAVTIGDAITMDAVTIDNDDEIVIDNDDEIVVDI